VTIRTSKKTVTFRKPFALAGFDEKLPAGTYEIETDEELLHGISFPVYRRTLTLLHLPTRPGRSTLSETVVIDANDLDAALKRDRTVAEVTDEGHVDQ